MKTGLARGLMRCRSHFEMGLGAEAVFLRDRRSNLCPPSVDQVARDDSRANEQFWVISPPRSIDELGKWTILESNAPGLRLDGRTAPNSPLPYEIIRKGFGILKDYGIPVARHVDLQTADRQEIERYSAISTLASKYIETDTWKRPLCLAVFGPPGCGKSFGIGQVANAITALKPDSRLTPMPFNLSQMRSVDALAKAFHQVRNRGLAGDMPLVLLDEFDSSHDGEEFGWLKFLLAPMQDGQFLDGDEVLHLPRCIIVCIGGQNRDFKELESRLRHKGFLDAKGRDFVSRLRNNLEIKGPDAYYREYSEEYASEKEAKGKEAKAFIGRKVRRAMLLRSTIETRLQVILQEVVENERLIKLANIDESVIRGFLDIPEYKHGVRSLEAIVEMSRALVTRRCFLKSSLPPEEQLDMHVDARDFLRYVRGTDQK
jgi:hypothetical protein